MKKVLLLSALMSVIGLSQAQEVNTYSVYDTDQSGEINVGDAVGVANQVVNDVTANQTQQYVTAEDLKTLFSTILSKFEGVETELSSVKDRLAAIEEKVGIETPGGAEEGMKAKTFTVNGVTFKMMPVEGGTFTMGATEEQSNGYSPDSDEKPTHQVTLSDYYIGETEVTQALWYAVMGAKPSSSYSWSSSYGLGDNYPAYYISWEECQTFITTLNTLTGATFRMPTEAEWEYAARGGSKSQGYIFSGSNTLDDVAWYYDNSYNKGSSSPDYGTLQVATKAANELGIYDMSGNVWEWCSDWFGSYSSDAQTNPTGASSGSDRVSRGGGWDHSATCCRVAIRGNFYPSNHYYYLGLRLALSQK